MYSITEINIKCKTCSIGMACEYWEVDDRKLWSIPSQSNWPPLPPWQRDSPQERQHHLVFVLINQPKSKIGRQYYTLVEQKAILLIFISIIDKDINWYSKWSWQKNQFELIKISIDSSIYGCICVYLEIEKNINW